MIKPKLKIKKLELLMTYENYSGYILDLCFIDDSTLVSACKNNDIEFLNIYNLNRKKINLDFPSSNVRRITYNKDDKTLACLSTKGSIKLINENKIKNLKNETEFLSSSIKYSHNNKYLIFNLGEKIIVRTDLFIINLISVNHIQSLAFDYDCKIIASGDIYGNVKIWDISTEKVINEFKAHIEHI